jgi:hypothetical protein
VAQQTNWCTPVRDVAAAREVRVVEPFEPARLKLWPSTSWLTGPIASSRSAAPARRSRISVCATTQGSRFDQRAESRRFFPRSRKRLLDQQWLACRDGGFDDHPVLTRARPRSPLRLRSRRSSHADRDESDAEIGRERAPAVCLAG